MQNENKKRKDRKLSIKEKGIKLKEKANMRNLSEEKNRKEIMECEEKNRNKIMELEEYIESVKQKNK